MKCFNHNAKGAVAVCSNCGRALCPGCIPSVSKGRVACSTDCAAELAANTKALHLLVDKTMQSARASAFYCYLTGGLSAAAAVGAWFMLPSPFLIYFTAACALALFAAGFWYGRVAREDSKVEWKKAWQRLRDARKGYEAG